MAKRNGKVDIGLRQQAAALRQQGFTINQIAAYLDTTANEALIYLGETEKLTLTVCRTCSATITKTGTAIDNIKWQPLCLRCLAKTPDASFGERLRALRLSRGLTHQELADATGVAFVVIRNHELELTGSPQWDTVVKLVRFLGPNLAGWEGGYGEIRNGQVEIRHEPD